MTEIPIPPFECSPGLRLSAHERISEIQKEAMDRRLDRLEMMMERMEKRLWLTVYGVAAVILAQAFQSFIVVQ
ncbi:GTA head formation protein, RCAP_rcc01685 family [Phaeobacter sp. C3_T13_0]|uniref:GTA head formation protein, RCAP_rcc01685 family n=1 Tax=Phaeobacter cretensis TaxID=3342641 RepID=UPI0039BD6B55